MSDTNQQFDSTITPVTGSSGQIHVPADAQREHNIGIDDMLKVTLSALDHEYVDEVSFTNPQTAPDNVTVPADLMREFDLGGQEVTATFEPIEDTAEEAENVAKELAETAESLGDSPGTEEVKDALDTIKEEVEGVEDDGEEDSEGLGQLFE